eukprot:GHVU01225827.1.p1 GENE.GHVU01225827.1~~GHVU01225827.1.p1  ORF type:complete len:231 (+),score=13.27 GHVU01225827.1:103-795(+)
MLLHLLCFPCTCACMRIGSRLSVCCNGVHRAWGPLSRIVTQRVRLRHFRPYVLLLYPADRCCLHGPSSTFESITDPRGETVVLRMEEEAALRDDAGTPEERAQMMEEAAVLMGQAARRAEERGEVTRRYTKVESGYEIEGEWRNGKLNGLGVCRRGNETIRYAGQCENNRLHGLGVTRNEDGTVRHAGWWTCGVSSQKPPSQYVPFSFGWSRDGFYSRGSAFEPLGCIQM